MVALTYAISRIAAPRSKTNAVRTKTVFARFMDALMESRMQQARRELMRHAHLLPKDFFANH
jgi:hypothetical protein